MKKFAKALGVLSALALLGAGFVSCSDDDGEEDKTPSLKVEADSAESVAAGDKIDVTLTATLTNDSFAGPVDAGESLASFVTITPSDPASFGDDLAVTAAEAIAEGATSAKVKVSVTTTAAAKSGTITVTIKADALKSGKDLTSNPVAYTIKEAEADPNVIWTWTVAEYVKSYDATGAKFGAETGCGNVTAGQNVKAVNKGDGISGTLSEGVTGYFQLSNGASGALYFTAPAGTKKITVCAKMKDQNTKVYLYTDLGSSTKAAEVAKIDYDASVDTQYRDMVFNVDIATDTVIYVTPLATTTLNLKAIQISK